MSKKLDLEQIAVSSFITRNEGETLLGGRGTNQRDCVTGRPIACDFTGNLVC